ncbi:MAG: hypothetical protein SXV54_09855, partial [Chloroflexota bacterium]|nr:hypothetical protein [Chloroflexota bacterium]
MDQNSYIQNPFSGWGEFDPRRVYGHTRLLQSIIEIVTEREPRAVNLVGPRWIGKTTVLRFLTDREGCFAQPKYKSAIGRNFTLPRLLPVYLDMATNFCPENPFATLADELYVEIGKRKDVDLHSVAREISLGEETAALGKVGVEKRMLYLAQEVAKQGVRLIVCLDHVDQTNLLADSTGIRQIDRLTKDASVVITTRKILADLYSGLAGSPLVHKLVLEKIGLLNEDAALDLLSPPLPSFVPQFCLEDKELLTHYIGRHPYLLVRAARQAYELLLSSPRGAHLTRNYIEVEIAPALEFIFEHLWRESSDQLRAFCQLHGEARGEGCADLEQAPRGIVQDLQRESLVYENPDAEGEYLFFSTLFESFVTRKLRRGRDKEESKSQIVESTEILEALGLS